MVKILQRSIVCFKMWPMAFSVDVSWKALQILYNNDTTIKPIARKPAVDLIFGSAFQNLAIIH